MEEIVFLLLFVGAKGQLPLLSWKEKPERCNRPAEFMYRQCCVFPPFFTREVARDCGAFFEVMSIDSVNNITALRRHPSTLCQHWKCILTKYDFLNSDDTFDEDRYYAHLDRWTTLNPSFKEVMLKAKTSCNSIFRLFFPLNACEFFDLHGCIRNFVNVQCPVIFPTKECYEMQQFYEECKEFFI